MLMTILTISNIGCSRQQTRQHTPIRPRVTLITTEGEITVELYNETPLHRDNFMQQVASGYYDSLLFHRVIRDFMIQGGDPTSRHAKAGERIGDETPEPTLPAEFRYPQYYHKRGALAAARESDEVNPERRSSAYQFYIVCGRAVPDDRQLDRIDSIQFRHYGVHLDTTLREYYRTHAGTPHLDGGYTVFGEVVEGMEVVDKIQHSATDRNDRPQKDIRILKAFVIKQ